MAGQILVIDDEERYAQMLRDLLDEHDFNAEYCIDPCVALEKIQREQFDLVVTDYKMPVIDGAEFLLRARRTNPDLPVIIVSGLMNMPELIKVANIGVTLVLEKPFDTQDFIQQVRRFAEPRTVGEGSMSNFLEEDYSDNVSVSEAPLANLELRELVASSHSTRRSVEALLAKIDTANFMFVESRVESDWTVLGTELASKRGCSDARRNLHLNLSELAVPDFRDEAFEDIETTRGKQWVSVECGDRPSNRLKEEIISTLLALDEAGYASQEFFFLFQVPLGYKVNLSEVESLRPIANKIFGPVVLGRFRDRIEDVAQYIRRLWLSDSVAPIELEESAIHLLLNYPWPGEYKELRGVVQRLSSSSAGNKITESQVIEVLKNFPGSREFLPEKSSLEAFLLRRQQDYIHEMGHSLGDWRATLHRMGIDPSVYAEVGQFEDLPILYPEIVTSSGGRQE